jgi:hypothetical protein
MFEVYSLVLFAHVLAAVAVVGHSIGSPLIRAALRDAASLSELGPVVALEQRAARWIPIIALALLASGIYLGSVGWWHFGWFYVSIAGWVANALLAGLLLHSMLARLAKAAAGRHGAIPAEIDALRRSKTLAATSQAMLANNLALLFVMFNKPDTVAALAVFAVANALLVGFVFLPRRVGRPVFSEVPLARS